MKKIVALFALAALLFSGCGAGPVQGEEVRADDNYVAVCVDEDGNRVDDSDCNASPEYHNDGSSISGFFWGYLIANALMPSYGSPVSGHRTYVDQTRHNVYRGGVPRTGGYVNFQTYKPLTSKVVKPKAAVNSPAYNANYNKSPNYTKPKVDTKKQNSGGSYNKPANKAPAPAPRRK